MNQRAAFTILALLSTFAAGVACSAKGATSPHSVKSANTPSVATAPAAGPQRVGRLHQLPDFTLTGLDGKSITAADLHGKVVLLDFWETWCVPCRYQARILESLWPDYKGGDVRFLAVDVSEDLETVRSFVSKNPFGYPVVRDANQRLSNQLGIVGLPTLLIADRDGRIILQKTGLSDTDSIKRAIAKALKE